MIKAGDIKLHSGQDSWWKIDCDDLSGETYSYLADKIIREFSPFSFAFGVPTGGGPLAAHINARMGIPRQVRNPILLVNDVLTTGASMEKARRDFFLSGLSAKGVVIFSRAERVPYWITTLFYVKENENVSPRTVS